MSRVTLSALSLLLGLIVGVALGSLVLPRNGAETPVSSVQHFYYKLNDSLIARHTISVSKTSLDHKVDTLAVEAR